MRNARVIQSSAARSGIGLAGHVDALERNGQSIEALDHGQRPGFVQDQAQGVVALHGQIDRLLEPLRIDRPCQLDVAADDVHGRVRMDELPEPDLALRR